MTRSAIKELALVVGTAAAVLVAYFVIPMKEDYAELLAALVVLGAVGALVPLAVRRAQQVLVSDRPGLVALQAVVTAVTVLVVSFSTLYYVLGTQHSDQIDGVATKIDGLYFSVTILSTVGFGDITATGQLGRAVVTLNMALNLVLLAIAVRVLTWALERAREQRPAGFVARRPRAD